MRAADAVDRRVEQVAQDMTLEMGKPIREARMEAARMAQILRFFGGEGLRATGERYEQAATGSVVYTTRRPVGVVAQITPWNFPAAIPAWKAAPALAYGNAVVMKLAQEAPLTGLHLAACFDEAELPPASSTSSSAAARPSEPRSSRIRRCARSPSPARCRSASRCEARRPRSGKRVQLELGGQNPLIVMADADLDRAAEAAYAGAFWSAGQKCTATRRIYAEGSVYDDFRARLLARMERGVVGDPSDPGTEVGPIVNEAQLDEVLEGIERGKADGGTLLAGGERLDDEAYLLAPALFEGLADDAFLSCEEVFGPVTSLYRFSTLDEALERANAVRFGLSAAIFTSSLAVRADVRRHDRGGHRARQRPDGRRGRPRALRWHQGLRLRPARAGPRRARVLHRRRHRLRGRVTPGHRLFRDLPGGQSLQQECDGVMDERFLVTGALGCLGAWTCKLLAEEGIPVVAFDLGDDPYRLREIAAPKELERVTFVRGDVTDLDGIVETMSEHAISHLVHLAALQVPFCKADPPRGARVNVVGTVNVFEAVKRLGLETTLAYASSAAVYDAAGAIQPTTLYGVFKLANEQTARVLRGGRRHRQHRSPPVRRLRPGTRPGADRRADARDAGGGGRRAVPHRLRRPDGAPLRGRRRPRLRPRRPAAAGWRCRLRHARLARSHGRHRRRHRSRRAAEQRSRTTTRPSRFRSSFLESASTHP